MHRRALVLSLTSISLAGCPGDDAGGGETGPATTTATDTAATSTAADSTTGPGAVECAALTNRTDCEAAQVDGAGACGWRSTSFVDPMTCLVAAGPGACFTATNLDGCYSEVPDSCGDGQAYFYRDAGDGTFEMFEDASMCYASSPFSPCEAASPAPDSPAGMACACRCP